QDEARHMVSVDKPKRRVYEPSIFTVVCYGVMSLQYRVLGDITPVMFERSGAELPAPLLRFTSVIPPPGLSTLPTTSQLSTASRPVLKPPCMIMPRGSRAFKDTSMPLYTSVLVP